MGEKQENNYSMITLTIHRTISRLVEKTTYRNVTMLTPYKAFVWSCIQGKSH